MRTESGRASPWAEWAWASEPLAGEPEAADLAVVVARPGGVLAAVVDGLGHGPPAVAAATRAIEVVRARATEPVDAVIAACHAALAGTRGAVLSVAAIDGPAGTLTWSGVGDVEAVRHSASGRRRESLPLLPGVIGDRVPRIRSHAIPIDPGDVLVLATDGLRRSFAGEPGLGVSPGLFAERLIREHGRRTDDALALVVRYDGAA